MLPRKTFATDSLKQTFVWDVWFDGQIVCFNIEHPSIIDKIVTSKFFVAFLEKMNFKNFNQNHSKVKILRTMYLLSCG